jgi:hypothetical protein
MFDIDTYGEDDIGNPLEIIDKRFKENFKLLVNDLHKLISELKSLQAPSPRKETTKIFFGHVAESLKETKTQIISNLQANNIEVLTGFPPPSSAIEHDMAVSEKIQESVLSVHLFDQFRDAETEEGPLTFAQQQVELAKGLGKQQVIYVSKQLDLSTVKNAQHRTFLDALENGKRENSNYNFIREASATCIAQDIISKIKSAGSPALSAPRNPAVFLDTHAKDDQHINDLINYFTDNGIFSYLPPNDEDPQKNISTLERRLKSVTSLIVVFGEVAEPWVKERLNNALKLMMDDSYPITTCGIYLAPPEKTIDKIPIKHNLLKVFDLLDNSKSNRFTPQTLMPLLNKMKRNS